MTSLLQIQSLSLAFESSPKSPIVEDFSTLVGPGMVGLCAPNGAGKSSLLHYLSGQAGIIAQSGQVLGLDATRVRYVGQGSIAAASVAEWLSPIDNAALTYRLSGAPWSVARRLSSVASGDLLRLIPDDRVSEQLSGGEKQIVVIARELAREPTECGRELLILDEPTTGLDFQRRIKVMEFVRKRMDQLGMAGIMVEHNLELLALYCDTVLVGTHRPMRIYESHSISPEGPRGFESLGSQWLSSATQHIQASFRRAMLAP